MLSSILLALGGVVSIASAANLTIVSPNHGMDVDVNALSADVAINGLTPGQRYRLYINGELDHESICTTAGTFADSVGVAILPEDSLAVGPDIILDDHPGYVYSTWSDDSARLFRPLRVELMVETPSGWQQAARDRVLLTDMRAFDRDSSTIARTVTPGTPLPSVSSQLTGAAIRREVGGLMLEQRPLPDMEPLENRVANTVVGDGLPVDTLSGEYCTPLDQLTVVKDEVQSQTALFRNAIRAGVTTLHATFPAVDPDHRLQANLDNFVLCVEPTDAARITALDLPEVDAIDVESGTDATDVTWITAEPFVGTFDQALSGRVYWSADGLSGVVMDIFAHFGVALAMPVAEGSLDCLDMPVGSLTPVTFTERVFIEPDASGMLSDVSASGLLDVDEMIGAASSWTCAEPMLNVGGAHADVGDLLTDVEKAARRVLWENWMEGGTSDREAHRLLEDSLSWNEVGVRGPIDPRVTLGHQFTTITERLDSASPAAVPTDHSGVLWRGYSVASVVSPARGSFSWMLAQTPDLRINEGDTVPDSLTGELSDDGGTTYDLAISVSLDTFNQMLAEAGTSEALNPTVDAADLTPWMLGLCLWATDDGCTTPLPATGKGLSAWIPELAELDDTPLRLRFQQTLPPTLTFNGNHSITVADKYEMDEDTGNPLLLFHMGQAQLVIETDTASPIEVLVVNVDVFDPEASITLGESDGWLEAEFATGEFRAETLRTGLSTMPETSALTAALHTLVQHMLVSPAAVIVEEVPMPELADLPRAEDFAHTVIGQAHHDGQVEWFLTLD